MANAQLGQVLRQLRRWVGGTADEAATDGQLLERFAVRREEAAFAALVVRYGPMVLGVCRRVLQHEQDAEDAFQASFLVLARKAGAIRRRESVGGWLYQVAYHIAVKARAGAARRRLLEQQVSEMFPTDSAEEAGWRELRPVLDEELSRLPRKYRDPLVSCYLQGKSNRQAADELGWPAGSMSRRLERARELLRERLVRRGITLSTGLLAAVLTENASATVPATMLAPTVRAAMLFTAGNTVAVGALSAPAAHIAQGVLKTMFYTKLKIAVAALLAVSVVTGGAGVVTNHVLNADQPSAG